MYAVQLCICCIPQTMAGPKEYHKIISWKSQLEAHFIYVYFRKQELDEPINTNLLLFFANIWLLLLD